MSAFVVGQFLTFAAPVVFLVTIDHMGRIPVGQSVHPCYLMTAFGFALGSSGVWLMGIRSAACLFAFLAGCALTLWWYGGGDDDWRRRKRRFTAWVKSHLPKPAPSRLLPAGAS